MNSSNTVFFSTANNEYALYAAISLLTIRDFIPEAELYLLSSGLTNKTRILLQRNNIKYLELDLSSQFTQSWEYPIDCYYIFAGPSIFFEKQYKYSVYIDGDILCQGDPLRNIKDISGVGGVMPSRQVSTDIFGEDWAEISKLWKFPRDVNHRGRINSGIVYFNNEKMHKRGLLEKSSELYLKCIDEGVPRKGDDSLFALFQLLYLEENEVQLFEPVYNYILQYNEWTHPIDNLVFFHFSIDKPWKNKPYTHKAHDLRKCNAYIRLWRKKYREKYFLCWLGTIRLLSPAFNVSKKVRAVASKIGRELYFFSQGLKKNYVKRKLNSRHQKPIKLFWWRSGVPGMCNFGDEITADTINRIFGYRSELTSLEKCEMIGAGSILQLAYSRESNNPISVWGSGLIEDGDYKDIKNTKVFAVRGEMTRSKLDLDCPIGDPGILANITYRRAAGKIKKIGVVVHYIDRSLPIVKKIMYDDRFLIINPLDNPAVVAEDISSCQAILSSSLHGLIFADSFGIPNAHIKLSNNVTGGYYKFKDYYTSVDREYSEISPEDILSKDIEKSITKKYKPISGLAQKQRSLIKAFPFD